MKILILRVVAITVETQLRGIFPAPAEIIGQYLVFPFGDKESLFEVELGEI